MENREKAIRLANEYKILEKRIPIAGRMRQDQIRQRIAEIASDMNDLGYSLPRLLLKRKQKHGR